ncbi:MAG: A24 family peptidase [Clostridiales Family XIII bacterium]|jgi:prepilin signal peptidase PulO-like enzyme (type II secretory pathway)|nr:A24 family peptidase [Clostridiales Family XIII bacterium]
MDNIFLLSRVAMLACSIVAGPLAGCGAVRVFNKMPAKWLCDYDEVPSNRHLPPRIGKRPWALLFSLVFATAVFKTLLVSWAYAAAALPALWSLLLVGLSDGKYRIIPDQFVILLAATGIGFAAIGQGSMGRYAFLSPLFGLLLGGGVFFLVAFLGKRILRKDIMGFGDVKLTAVCGLIAGFLGVIAIMVMTALSSAAYLSLRLARGSIRATDEAPLGPFIAGATAVYLLFSQEIAYVFRAYLEMSPGVLL